METPKKSVLKTVSISPEMNEFLIENPYMSPSHILQEAIWEKMQEKKTHNISQ
jgi:hypothetical protein